MPRARRTRATQIREAQRADERTFAYFARFRTALTARFGNDPLLSMLEWTEQEAQALVHAHADGPGEHVIYQTGKWISTDGRELKPWAPRAPTSLTRLRLSAVSEPMLREKLRAYRAQPAKAADSLAGVKVGYFGKPFDRLVAEITVIGMSLFGLSAIVLDPDGAGARRRGLPPTRAPSARPQRASSASPSRAEA